MYYQTTLNIYTNPKYSLQDNMIYTIIAQRMITETSIKLMFLERTLDLYLLSGLTSEHNVTQMLSKFLAAASHIILFAATN